MAQVQHHVVLVRTAAAAFLDFLVHRTRDEVARRQILQGRRIALHEAFAFAIDQDAAFAAHAFGDQYARAGHAGRVELPEFHVLQRQAGACRHAHAVARVDEGVGRRGEDAACAARCHDRRLCFQDHAFAGFHFQRDNTDHVAFGVTDQVECHPFDEEMRAGTDVALVQGVQQGVTGTVGCRASALHRLFAEVGRVAAEWTLVDGAVRVAVEWHAEVFQFVHDLRCFAAHEFDGILVAQVVAALDGVEHVPEPVVFGHVAERRADTALRCHGVRAGREDFRENCDVQAGFSQLQRRAHAGTAGANDDRIKAAGRDCRFICCHDYTLQSICTVQPAQAINHSMVAICRVRRRPALFT